MKTATKMGLFGGTLLAAGILVSPATADFNIDGYFGGAYDFTKVSGYDYLSYLGQSQSNSGISSSSYAFTLPNLGGSGYAVVSAAMLHSEMNSSVGSSGYHYARPYAQASAVVNVDTPTDILIEWDFTQTPTANPLAANNISVFDFSTSYYVYYGFQDTAGSAIITLNPGVNYWLNITTRTELPDVSVWGSITIVPTPGAVALLGVAGVVARKRRRRNGDRC